MKIKKRKGIKENKNEQKGWSGGRGREVNRATWDMGKGDPRRIE